MYVPRKKKKSGVLERKVREKGERGKGVRRGAKVCTQEKKLSY